MIHYETDIDMDLEKLTKYVVEGKSDDAEAFTIEALSKGMNPKDILNKGLIPGMDIVGDKFQSREYFMPEMLVSAKAMKKAMTHIKPLLSSSDTKSNFRVICGTVSGDLHDIGISLVGMMLEGAGFEVIYLGPDNTADDFISAMEEKKAQVLCMSALLTTTIKNMEITIQKAKELEVRHRMRIYVGGAPVTKEFASHIGADGYKPDAASAAKMIKKEVLLSAKD
ncbi:MAG: corrinoid protein [SAR202 cluster bacterium]|nr:corrinoid protein [SAR202 cluster bacterium]